MPATAGCGPGPFVVSVPGAGSMCHHGAGVSTEHFREQCSEPHFVRLSPDGTVWPLGGRFVMPDVDCSGALFTEKVRFLTDREGAGGSAVCPGVLPLAVVRVPSRCGLSFVRVGPLRLSNRDG